MKPIERLQAAVNFEEYDRPPFMDTDWVAVDIVPHFSGCKPDRNRRYSESDRVNAIRKSQDAIPFNRVYEGSYPILGKIPEKRDGERFVRDGVHYVSSGFTSWVEARPFSDADGFINYLEKRLNKIRGSSADLPADFEEKIKYAKDMLGDTVIGYTFVPFFLDDLYRLAGWDILSAVIADNPDLIAEYLSTRADLSIRKIHMDAEYFKDCPFALIYSDIAFNGGLLLSPGFLRFALIPVIRKVVEAFQEHNIKAIYHSEGDLTKIIDDLIDAGCEGINPLAPSENMDPVRIRKEYPNLILWGGIDNTTVLHSGTPEEVESEVRRVVDGVGKGLILASSGGVDPGCKLDNCIAMAEALRKMGE